MLFFLSVTFLKAIGEIQIQLLLMFLCVFASGYLVGGLHHGGDGQRERHIPGH